MGAVASSEIAASIGQITEADVRSVFNGLSQADKDKVVAAVSPVVEAPATDAPTAETPAAEASAAEVAGDPRSCEGDDELTPAEFEEFRKKMEAEKAACWEKMRETGTWSTQENVEAMRAEREQTARDVLEARKFESVPDWVDGPRPSDELLAMGEPTDPFAMPPSTFPPGWQKGVLIGRLPNESFRSEYEMPSFVKLEPVDANGVPCVWCNWPGTSTVQGVILYMHGGGGVSGDIEDRHCAKLSCASGLRVLTVDYRLAPEHCAKLAVEDLVTAYLWLTQTTPSEKVVVYGTSYGGFLVMALLQALLQRGHQLPACGVSESPIFAHAEFGFPRLFELLAGSRSWFGPVPGAKSLEEIIADPFYNVLGGPLKGLPPMYVSVGSLEPIVCQVNPAKALFQACRDARVQVELDVARNLRHVPCGALFSVPEATAYVARIIAFMHKYLGGDSTK